MYNNQAQDILLNQSFLRAMRLQRLERIGKLTPVYELKCPNKTKGGADDFSYPGSNLINNTTF